MLVFDQSADEAHVVVSVVTGQRCGATFPDINPARGIVCLLTLYHGRMDLDCHVMRVYLQDPVVLNAIRISALSGDLLHRNERDLE